MLEGRLTTPGAIAAALALSCVGALFYNMLPLYLGTAQDARDLSGTQLGLINGAFFLGYNVLAFSAFAWIRRWSWRRACLVATPIALAALAAGALSSSFVVLLFTSIAAGAAFSALYGIGATAIGDTTNPTRWYGVKITLEGAFGALLFLILPNTLVATYGFAGLVAGMLIASVILLPLFFFLPHGGPASNQASEIRGNGTTVSVTLFLVGIFLFFSGETTIWAFVERLGSSAGFNADALGTLLSLALVAAFSGSLVAAVVADRFGNVLPLILACLLFLAALFVLTDYSNFQFYRIGALTVMFSVGCGISYAVSEVARQDPDGRFVVLTVPAIGLGAMLGPGVAGWLSDQGGIGTVLTFGAVTVGLAIPLFLAGARLANRT